MANVTKQSRPDFTAPTSFVPHVSYADAIAFFPDSASYYAAIADILPQAHHSIVVVGWSLDDRVALKRDDEQRDAVFGDVILSIARGNPAIGIVLAIWKPPAFFSADQHISDRFRREIETQENITLRWVRSDSAFRALHEKYVIVDRELLFFGGMDISQNRWDTLDHRSDNRARVNPDGETYVPYHDVQAVLKGLVVDDFYRLAVEDNIIPALFADTIERPTVGDRLWPSTVGVDVAHVKIAIARTRPTPESEAHPEATGIDEIGELYLRFIDAAQRSIYMENQYFSSDEVTEALIGRLQERDGPEVILVVPRELPDAVGQWTMGVNSSHHISVLRQHDPYQRLFVCNPVAPDDPSTAVKVHSKIMIVDGRYVTFGSANISRRSFYLDMESNVAFDAGESDDHACVQRLERRLLSQHAGLSPEEWEEQLKGSDGSRITVLRTRSADYGGLREHSRRQGGTPIPPEFAEKFDMDHPPPQEMVMRRIARIDPGGIVRRIRKNWVLMGAVALIIGAAILLSRYDVDVDQILERISSLQSTRPFLAAIGTVLAYWLSMAVFVSIVVPIVFFAALHGPWWGILYSVIGLFTGAAIFYALGIVLHHSKWLNRFSVVRAAKEQLQKIRPYGLWAVAISRMVPSGPFMVVNIVTGMIGFTPRQFLAGSVIGLVPGIVAFSLFGDVIRDVFTDPSLQSIFWFVFFLVAYTVLVRLIILGVKRIAGWAGSDR